MHTLPVHTALRCLAAVLQRCVPAALQEVKQHNNADLLVLPTDAVIFTDDGFRWVLVWGWWWGRHQDVSQPCPTLRTWQSLDCVHVRTVRTVHVCVQVHLCVQCQPRAA